jgi:hypothetical protein
MPVQFFACEMLIGQVLTMTFLEIAMEGLRIADRHSAGATTLTALLGISGFQGTDLAAPRVVRERRINVRVDLWIVELIEELVGSRKPAHVRGFIRDAVLAYVDRMAAAPEDPCAATRTAS